MKKIINSTLYDYLLNAAFLIIVIAFGVVFHSSPLIILSANKFSVPLSVRPIASITEE